MTQTEHDEIAKNVRRTAGINALRKIGLIVAEDQRAEEEKAAALHWFPRYGWLVLLAGALLLAYLLGII